MSCFREGTNFARSSLKAKRNPKLSTSRHQDKKSGVGSCPPTPSAKQLKSLQRQLEESLSDTEDDTKALSLKIEYVNCLCDNGRFREALSVLIDLLEQQEQSHQLRISEDGDNADFKQLSSTCSVPVFDVEELLSDAKTDRLKAEFFQDFVISVAKTTINVANKNSGFLRHINKENTKRLQHTSGDDRSQFVDYKVSPGQITPCPWSCPSCSGVLIEPISLQCGHTFCKSCLTRIAKAAKVTRRAHCMKCGALWFPTPKHSNPPTQESEETEPKTPLEALEQLNVNVLVNRLCERYWTADITAVQHRQDGNRHFRSGKCKEAVAAYGEAIKLVPNEYYALGNRANALQKIGDFEGALKDAQAAVESRPDWAKGYFRKGSALQKLNLHEEAFYAFFECLSIEIASANDTSDAAREAAVELFTLLKHHVSNNPKKEDKTKFDPETVSIDSGVSTLHSSSSSVSLASSKTDFFATVNAPQPVLNLVDYASHIYEKQSNLELMTKPTEPWYVRGVLTYRKSYRNIPDDQVDSSDYECPLCYRLLWQPVTTSCGHTYCKVCLEQALDHNVQCPLCKSSIVKNILEDRRETVPNEFIESSMQRLLSKEYNERKSVHYCDMRENGNPNETNVIPMFVCTISAPNIPCPLHIFEPRYRLMIRRAMESGTREFGMSCKVDDKPFADYGTMLEIRDVQYFSDGRSIIDTVGGRRFRVLERGTRDGYNTAKVEFIQDEEPKDDILSNLQTLHDATFWKAGQWFAHMDRNVKAGILMHYGNLPEPENDYWKLPNGPSWIWWLLVILPLAAPVQVQVLSQTSLKKRLEIVAHVLRLVSPARRPQQH